MFQSSDFRGLFAIMPTPAKDGSERFGAFDTVDLAETARVVDRLIADGANGLIVLGTTGECATVTGAEYEPLVECVMDSVAKRVPVFVGVTALGAHEVASRARFAAKLGADGVLLGMPMWQPLTVDMAVAYYSDFSSTFPDLAVMVYGNGRAFRFDFPPEFWARVAESAPTVVAAKYSRPKVVQAAMDASKGHITFLPHDLGVFDFYKNWPTTTKACWSTAASMGPAPSLAVVRAILAGDTTRAEAVAKDIKWAHESIVDLIHDPDVFASFNIQIEKLRINAAGYCKAGPIRPPYHIVPHEYVERATECGRRWAEICPKYQAATV
jgi:trans-o-hydroxybenzylidenepyruvate hydratase-aldolase